MRSAFRRMAGERNEAKQAAVKPLKVDVTLCTF
jgi:hypothetical protein